jgi:hypothetical protein
MSATQSAFPINSFQIGSGPAAAYFQSVGQSISDSTYTTVNFQTKEFDADNTFNTSTGIFRPKVAGIYQINAVVTGTFSAGELLIVIFKNGVVHKRGNDSTSTLTGAIVSSLVVLNGNDYIEFKIYQTSGAPISTSAGVSVTYFNAAWIRGL